ncbi:hypothetical protein HMPREF0005_02032 [Achromobacter xylosoxidans C54]|uniref:hypothetical protein n=1 Tax=Alcaligenes xylosoxydans xylosoxydans TaxID=85698 RepID=UPI0001F429D5|nr:hypothetical protein [Achromobacter xylosoxidans]EFV83906.1 hypothetical protein HMPREF0005_02032 [Achromobacter xylosoxidans C54]
MADYGFRARNGSNEIQIDSTYKNFALRDKGVITASEGWFHGNFRQANAYTARNAGIVAFRSNGAATLYGMSPSGSGMSLNFLGYQPGGTPVTIWWYVFDEPIEASIPSGERYGMVVKNASWVKTFDSRIDYMRMADFWSGTANDIPSTSSGLPPSFALRVYPGITPAIIQGNMCNSQTEVPIGVGPGVQFMQFRMWQMAKQDGGTIGQTICVEDYGPSATPSNWPDIRRTQFSSTIIDVTGL